MEGVAEAGLTQIGLVCSFARLHEDGINQCLRGSHGNVALPPRLTVMSPGDDSSSRTRLGRKLPVHIQRLIVCTVGHPRHVGATMSSHSRKLGIVFAILTRCVECLRGALIRVSDVEYHVNRHKWKGNDRSRAGLLEVSQSHP